MKKSILLFIALAIFSCEEKINTVNNYDFEFCENCKTLKDVYAFEKSRGAKEIILTGKQANKVFKSISCPFFPNKNSSIDMKKSEFFFLREAESHFVKEISAYSIIGDEFFFTARKYFYNDAVLDTIVELDYNKGFDKNEFRAMFNFLREEYRTQFKDVEESHYDMNESCIKKRPFEIETPKFLKKNLDDTHSIWSTDSLSLSLIYDFSYMYNKLNEETSTIELDAEDRAIYLLKK